MQKWQEFMSNVALLSTWFKKTDTFPKPKAVFVEYDRTRGHSQMDRYVNAPDTENLENSLSVVSPKLICPGQFQI